MPDESGHIAFVTGGTGFVGSHLVEHLLDNGFREVRCLVRNDLKFLEGLPIKVIRGDVSDRGALSEGIQGADFVFHNAAILRAKEWGQFLNANVEGTDLLLRTIRDQNPGVKKVVVTSSLAAVGKANVPIADESTPLNPISDYGRSKSMMEAVVKSFSTALPIVVIRPPAVYGPRESDIFTFFQALSRGICPIVGSGKKKSLSLVHVSDLVRGMLQAAESPRTEGVTYFLGGPAQYGWHEIRDAAATALGRKVVTVRIPKGLVGAVGAVSEFGGKLLGTYPPLNREKAAEIRHACLMCDHTKAATEFDYKPEVDVWAGIDETIKWYRMKGWLK